MAPLHLDTKAKPPVSKGAQLASLSPPGDTVRVITVPATQASLELFPDSRFSRFWVFFPVRDILPLTLPRLVHPEFLCLWRPECPLLKKTFSDCHISGSLCLPHARPLAPIPCEFLTYHSKISNDKVTVRNHIEIPI